MTYSPYLPHDLESSCFTALPYYATGSHSCLLFLPILGCMYTALDSVFLDWLSLVLDTWVSSDDVICGYAWYLISPSYQIPCLSVEALSPKTQARSSHRALLNSSGLMSEFAITTGWEISGMLLQSQCDEIREAEQVQDKGCGYYGKQYLDAISRGSKRMRGKGNKRNSR